MNSKAGNPSPALIAQLVEGPLWAAAGPGYILGGIPEKTMEEKVTATWHVMRQ